MKDLFHDLEIKKVIAPISPSTTGTITGTVIDRQNAASVLFVISNGAVTTTALGVTPTVYSGSATGSLTSVTAANLIGTEAGATFDSGDAGQSAKIGYIGSDRYVRVDLLVDTVATGVHSCIAILGNARKNPQDTQMQS